MGQDVGNVLAIWDGSTSAGDRADGLLVWKINPDGTLPMTTGLNPGRLTAVDVLGSRGLPARCRYGISLSMTRYTTASVQLFTG